MGSPWHYRLGAEGYYWYIGPKFADITNSMASRCMVGCTHTRFGRDIDGVDIAGYRIDCAQCIG